MSAPVRKSAVRMLIEEADAYGITKLVWELDPRNYQEEDDRDRWTCRANVPLAVEVVSAVGRTGEEALRRIVEFVRRVR